MPNRKSPFRKEKIFLYSFFSGLRITLIGQISIGEIIAISDSLSIKKWETTFRTLPDVKKINIAYFVFLISQIISDIVNHSSFNNSLRGWANIIMAMVLVTFLARNMRNAPVLIITFLVGEILSLIFFAPTIEGLTIEDMAFFKFRLAPILNNLVLIGSWYLLKNHFSKIYVIILLTLYGLFCVAFDFRSNGVFMILTAFIILNSNIFKRVTISKSILFFGLFLILFQGIFIVYVSNVLNGKWGGKHSYEQISRLENPYNPISFLKTGRSEVFVAGMAILDKPVFGHGSWAPDKDGKYTRLALEMHDDEDKFENILQIKDGLIIPSHSIILGAWMTAGIGGFLSVLYIAFLFFKRGVFLLRIPFFRNSAYAPILVFFILNAFWTFMFSPLPHIRLDIPIKLALILTLYQQFVNINRTYSQKFQMNKPTLS